MAYKKVQHWSRNVDLFSKKFVFFPVVDNLHWSLACVANLDKLEVRWKKANDPKNNAVCSSYDMFSMVCLPFHDVWISLGVALATVEVACGAPIPFFFPIRLGKRRTCSNQRKNARACSLWTRLTCTNHPESTTSSAGENRES